MNLLLALLPVVCFYVAEARLGLGNAIALSLIASLPGLWWTWRAQGTLDKLTLAGVGLAAVLGGLSWLSDDPLFVLWTPAIGDFAVSLALAFALLRGWNPLASALQAARPSETLDTDELSWLRAATWRMAGLTALHGVASAWAVEATREVWLLITGVGGWVVLGLWLGLEALLMRFDRASN